MSREPHPLLGLLLQHHVPIEPIANDLGASVADVNRWASGWPMPRRYHARLREIAGNWLDFKWEQAGRLLLVYPHLAKNPEFREHLQWLGEAHWIVFGVHVADRLHALDVAAGRESKP